MSREAGTEVRLVAKGGGLEEWELASNGLRVVLMPNPRASVVAVCVLYHVGSRHEGAGQTGATHLLEHLLFKGSTNYHPSNGQPLARVMERVGAVFNATTWLDRTNYYETLPPEHLDLALAVEADRMRGALLRPEDLATEMEVVRNELERGENDPFEVLLKGSFATAYREHPYRHPTIGWRHDVERATIEGLRAFYDTFYYPDNASLIVVGAFARRHLLARVAHFFGPLPRSPRPVPHTVTQECPQEGERRFIVRRRGEVGWVGLSWHVPAAAHPDTPALAVLADALGGGVTSRLYQRLVETNLCLDLQAIAWQLRDPGLFQLFATLAPGVEHARVEELIRQEVRRVARGVSTAELRRAKAQVQAHTAYHRDSPGQVAAALTEAIAAVDWRFYVDYLPSIRAVSRGDVVRVAETYFSDDNLSVGWFVPTAGGPPGTGSIPPVGPQPCAWRPRLLEGVWQEELGGGARVILLPRRGNPTVSVYGSLLAGHGMVPPAQWSAASLLPDVLERGSASRDRMAIARHLEDRGIEFGIGGESFNPLEVAFSGRSLARHFAGFLQLLLELLREPSLPAEELEKVRAQRLGELAQSQEDTFQCAWEAFCQLVYPAGHPWAVRPYAERRRGLETLCREELVSLHAALYGPGSLVLAAVGQLDVERTLAVLDKAMAGWRGGQPPPDLPRRPPAAGAPAERWLFIADKPNVDVLLGHPGGLRRQDEDFIAAQLANAVLGHSTLSSRLGSRLRDREGLTYGVVSRFFGAGLVDGPWALTFSVSPTRLERAVAAAREEMERYCAAGPSEEELEEQRLALAGSYRVSLATPVGLARELARLARYGLPLGEVEELPRRVLATSRQAVQAAIAAHLAPAHLCLAAAGELVDHNGTAD